jgi:hypothetical protein
MKQGEPRVGQSHKVPCYSVVIDSETFRISGADYEPYRFPAPPPEAPWLDQPVGSQYRSVIRLCCSGLGLATGLDRAIGEAFGEITSTTVAD